MTPESRAYGTLLLGHVRQMWTNTPTRRHQMSMPDPSQVTLDAPASPLAAVWTVETPTGCACCNDADVYVVVFQTEELAREWAAVEGGDVRHRPVRHALPPLGFTVHLSTLFTDGNQGPVNERRAPYFTPPAVAGEWTPKSENYEGNGDQWRGSHQSDPQYRTIETWAIDCLETRKWFADAVAAHGGDAGASSASSGEVGQG